MYPIMDQSWCQKGSDMRLAEPSTPPSIAFPGTPLVTVQGLRDWLQGISGTQTRPSRELILSWRAKGMPIMDLGTRTIWYDPRQIWDWLQSQSVSRPVPQVARDAGQRIVTDPRLRHPKR